MQTLTNLVHLLDATSDDRWAAGHPSTRPRLSPADRAHDLARPDDPTADTVADPARLYLAAAWRLAMDHVARLAAYPPSLRARAIEVAAPTTAAVNGHLADAWSYWRGEVLSGPTS